MHLFMCQHSLALNETKGLNIDHILENDNLRRIFFYPRWIMQFWINIPVSYTRSKVSNVIVKMSQTTHYLFKCLSMLKFCNLPRRILPLFYECAQPCMNAIILTLYRHDRELISAYFICNWLIYVKYLCEIFELQWVSSYFFGRV